MYIDKGLHMVFLLHSSYVLLGSVRNMKTLFSNAEAYIKGIVTGLNQQHLITSPPEGVARYCFHPVCLSVCLCVCVSVCVCVRPIFWYFIYRLLEEISI